jgi:hypothetical protein
MAATSSRIDVGDFLDRGEAFGDQQLGDDLVDVQGFLEQAVVSANCADGARSPGFPS